MLTHLYIRHYALIQDLDIDLREGFSVLTGETGAGKSIILGALALVMGARADTKSITEGEDKCIIEATFEDTIIRRELYANGRSRSFVNDEVVTQAELKILARQLIDIHSQHENLLLQDDSFQLGIVDALAHNEVERSAYEQQYDLWTTKKQALADLRALAAKTKQDADYIAFQYQQLQEMHLTAGEQEELEQEHYRLSHAEELQGILQESLGLLDEDENGAIQRLHRCRVEKVSEELQERLNSVEIELKDIAQSLAADYERIELNPARLQAVEERISAIETLLRKHKVQTVEELMAIEEELAQQMQRIDSFDEDIAKAEQDVRIAEEQLNKLAARLTKSREAVQKPISQQLISDLTKLNIVHANIAIAITPLEEFTPTGKDFVQFMFAANLNQSLRPVSEVASGGEISRIMLCLKALVASVHQLPTIIFDEIDTGVGGETATQMGRIMRQMADSRQIIAITHLPQIAAQGTHHYKVYKADTQTRTETHISELSQEERITEIASMISGKNLTEEAIANAKQLLCCP